MVITRYYNTSYIEIGGVVILGSVAGVGGQEVVKVGNGVVWGVCVGGGEDAVLKGWW